MLPSPSPSSQTHTTLPVLSLPSSEQKQLRDRLGEIVARTVQAISADFEERQQKFRVDPRMFNGGIWYSNTYYEALKEAKQVPRIKWMVENHRFYLAHGPKEAFTHCPDKDSLVGYRPNALILKVGVSASEALKAAQSNLCLLDCSSVCVIGQYQALYEVLGKEKFDKLFDHGIGGHLVISDYTYLANPLRLFLKEFAQEPNGKLLKGQRVAFMNDSRYREKHLMGEATALNAVVLNGNLNEPTFVALGVSGKGATKQQVDQFLIDEYNAPPLGMDAHADKLADQLFPYGGKEGYRDRCTVIDSRCGGNTKRFEARLQTIAGRATKTFIDNLKQYGEPLTIAKFKENKCGFVTDTVMDFKIDLIQELIRLPLSEVSYAFVQEHHDRNLRLSSIDGTAIFAEKLVEHAPACQGLVEGKK